jgi:hypothetical protein
MLRLQGAGDVRPMIAIIAAFLNPLFAEGGPINVDAGPTWTLAGACVAFLGALTWAIRVLIVEGKRGVELLYSDVVKPAAASHIALMEALQETRVSDSASLKSIAELQQAIRVDIGSLKNTRELK